MRLIEEIAEIERRMVEVNRADLIAVRIVAIVCFALLALCWLIALVMP